MPGAVALSHRLKALGSPWPLVIIATPTLDGDARQALQAAGIQIRDFELLEGNSAGLQVRCSAERTQLTTFSLRNRGP